MQNLFRTVLSNITAVAKLPRCGQRNLFIAALKDHPGSHAADLINHIDIPYNRKRGAESVHNRRRLLAGLFFHFIRYCGGGTAGTCRPALSQRRTLTAQNYLFDNFPGFTLENIGK